MRFPALSAGPLAVLATALPMTLAATLMQAGCHRADQNHGGRTGAAGAEAGMEAPIPPVTAQAGIHIALLYSSNLQGEFEHCGCPSHPLGGLARRATLFDRARAEADGVLAVDAGDLLLPLAFHSDRPHRPEPGEVERRARLLLESYARLGMAALLPAERDLGVGLPVLRRLLKTTGVPVVASNLVDRQGQPVFERDRIVTVAGVPIGIFGVVRPLAEDQSEWERWGVTATDPAESAREEIASLKKRGARMIVALLHLGPAQAARELLKAAPGITWAVQGHAGMQFETAETIGGARLLEAMSLGKLAGRLDIHVVGDQTTTFSDRGERAEVLTILSDHR
jgi:2',3'-cyclic-nucleotide 2'-phosphodiesterase (5'-nucleotidase family)